MSKEMKVTEDTAQSECNGWLACARSTHGFIMCQSYSDSEVIIRHAFNRTSCEVRIPVEVWALFLRSAKEAPIYHGYMKNSEAPNSEC